MPTDKLNPALLTFNEYLEIVNSNNKWHSDSAYDTDLKHLNSYGGDKTKSKPLRQMKIKGITFEFRLGDDDWSKTPFVDVFNDEGQRVASIQDEWGCVLIMVAREYRGFGLGPILGKIARTLEPGKPSGGFTPSGYRNFVKVYREMVRDALTSGFYTSQVRQGKMTLERVKEIIASADIKTRLKQPTGDLSTTGPKDWMLYVGGHGDFVLYDRKLKDVIEKEEHDYWIEKMVLGVMLVRAIERGDEWRGLVVAFGGNSDKIKKLMMTCAITYCREERIPFYVDPDDLKYVDPNFGEIAPEPDWTTGYARYVVTPRGEPIDLLAFQTVERHFRRQFDKYDEFKNRMLEIAFSKWRAGNVEESLAESVLASFRKT